MLFDPEYGGSGLGLSICKQLPRLMNGNVWVRSETGRGSRFSFTAWLDEPEREWIADDADAIDKKMLLAGKNMTNLDILSHMLESMGVRITVLNRGEDVLPALVTASQDCFDICMLDIALPGVDIN